MIRIFRKIVLLILIIPFAICAQEGDVGELFQQVQASGMSESELEAAALAKGLSPEKIKALKEQLLKAKANKKPAANGATNSPERTIDIEPVNLVGSNSGIGISPVSRVFGANIFRNSKPTFEPNLKLPTPKNYILGAGDELMIDISGYAVAHYAAKISSEGSIKLENLNPIYISGATIESASQQITNRLRTIFPGLGLPKSGAAIDITLGNIRSIKVLMIGEVTQPGTYTLPSLATVFNALYAAGGPTDKGTFRNIEIYRNGKPFKKLDVYDFLLRGDQHNNVVLQDQDVIRIPFVKRQVDINGFVKAPLVYEIEDNENLGTVLDFAGGFSDEAYKPVINVERISRDELEVITVFEKDIKSFQLKTGDKIIIDRVADTFSNIVSVAGAVQRPGSVSLTQAKTVKGLLEIVGGIRSDALTNRATIVRGTKTGEKELISFDLQKLLETKGEDITLVNNDTVIIKSLAEIREEYAISISGEIRNPGKIPYQKNLSLGDVIMLAGGFRDGANIDLIEIARRIKNPDKGFKEGDLTQIFQLKVDANLKILADEAQQILEPYDQIIIRPVTNYVPQQFVAIAGEVNYPGQYAIQNRSERISEIITRAGGLRKEAFLHGSQFKRNGRFVGIDLDKIVSNPGGYDDLNVLPGDEIVINKVLQTVTIVGEVQNPAILVFDGSQDLMHYVEAAGGLNDSANIKKSFVTYLNGKSAITKKIGFTKKYPLIESGSMIYIPKKEKRNRNRMTVQELTAIASIFSSLALIVLTYVRLNQN